MGQVYAHRMQIGTQSLPTTATQLTAPSLGPSPSSDGEVVCTLLVSSDSAFSYSDAEDGTYMAAGLNPSTSRYEKLFPIDTAFGMWFKSASGTISVEWEALINRRSYPSLR